MTRLRKRRHIREIVPEVLKFEISDSAPPFELEQFERRRFKRAIVQAPIEFKLVDESGNELCRGRATLHDLSLDGAFLRGIELEQSGTGVGAGELERYQYICFLVTDGPFKGAEASAKPVRADFGEGGVGVRLDAGFSFTV